MQTTPSPEDYLKVHYIHRSNWLRAAVLGANDGLLSTASLAIGVASASATREPLILAALAGIVGGALSMAAGEYVSVSSQTDIEQADIAREKIELAEMPALEQQRLAQIYEQRGLSKETALKVAEELTAHNALDAHVRDELGIQELTQANPIQAALASGASFTIGGVLPLVVTWLAPLSWMTPFLYGSTLVFLIVLGYVAAKAGGAPPLRAMLRISFWGTVAMGLSAVVGYIFGVNI